MLPKVLADGVQRLRIRRKFSVNGLRQLYSTMLKNLEVDERNEAKMVELVRQVAEMVVYGEQNGVAMFEYFCEKNMLALLADLMTKRSTALRVQVLQTLGILVSNVEDTRHLYYMLSNNHLNELIGLPMASLPEEVLSSYAAFLKTLGLRLDAATVQFFFNFETRSFPIFTKALQLVAASRDPMLQMAGLTTILTILRIPDPPLQDWLATRHVLGRFFDHMRDNALFAVQELAGLAAPSWEPGALPASAASGTAEAAERVAGRSERFQDQFMCFEDVSGALASSPNGERFQHGLRHYVLHHIVLPLALAFQGWDAALQTAEETLELLKIAAEMSRDWQHQSAADEQVSAANVAAAEATLAAANAGTLSLLAFHGLGFLLSSSSDAALLQVVFLLLAWSGAEAEPRPLLALQESLAGAEERVKRSRRTELLTLDGGEGGDAEGWVGYSRDALLVFAEDDAPGSVHRGIVDVLWTAVVGVGGARPMSDDASHGLKEEEEVAEEGEEEEAGTALAALPPVSDVPPAPVEKEPTNAVNAAPVEASASPTEQADGRDGTGRNADADASSKAEGGYSTDAEDATRAADAELKDIEVAGPGGVEDAFSNPAAEAAVGSTGASAGAATIATTAAGAAPSTASPPAASPPSTSDVNETKEDAGAEAGAIGLPALAQEVSAAPDPVPGPAVSRVGVPAPSPLQIQASVQRPPNGISASAPTRPVSPGLLAQYHAVAAAALANLCVGVGKGRDGEGVSIQLLAKLGLVSPPAVPTSPRSLSSFGSPMAAASLARPAQTPGRSAPRHTALKDQLRKIPSMASVREVGDEDDATEPGPGAADGPSAAHIMLQDHAKGLDRGPSASISGVSSVESEEASAGRRSHLSDGLLEGPLETMVCRFHGDSSMAVGSVESSVRYQECQLLQASLALVASAATVPLGSVVPAAAVELSLRSALSLLLELAFIQMDHVRFTLRSNDDLGRTDPTFLFLQFLSVKIFEGLGRAAAHLSIALVRDGMHASHGFLSEALREEGRSLLSSPLRPFDGGQGATYCRGLLGAGAARRLLSSSELLQAGAGAATATMNAAAVQREAISKGHNGEDSEEKATGELEESMLPVQATISTVLRRFLVLWQAARGLLLEDAENQFGLHGPGAAAFPEADARLLAFLGDAGPTENSAASKEPVRVHALVLGGAALAAAQRGGHTTEDRFAAQGRGPPQPPSAQVTCLLGPDRFRIVVLQAKPTADPTELWSASIAKLKARVDERGTRCLQVAEAGSRGPATVLAFDTEKSCRVVKRHLERQRQRIAMDLLECLQSAAATLGRAYEGTSG